MRFRFVDAAIEVLHFLQVDANLKTVFIPDWAANLEPSIARGRLRPRKIIVYEPVTTHDDDFAR